MSTITLTKTITGLKRIIFILMMLLFCYCNGQGREAHIQQAIDSLDQIQPEAFKKVRLQGRAYTIKVRNQHEFEGLNEAIAQAIDAGRTSISIKIGRGTYRFKENHVTLKDVHQNVAITIVGKKAVLTSCSDLREADNTPWQEMVQMDDIIQVIDKDKKLCKIPFPNQWNEETRRAMARIQVTQWFRAPVYDVEKIDAQGIYFIAKELEWDNNYGRKGYNVNYDYLYLGKNPRFRLYDKRKSVAAMASCFLKVENTEGVTIDLSGISFKGNKSGQPLIAMSNVETQQVYIHNCTFERIHGNVGNFSNVNNVTFDQNIVRNSDGHEVRFVKNCGIVRVTNNFFENCGQAIGNTFCVTCWESSYYIAHNTFRDFGYGAIGVGVWHGFTKEYPSKGIIEHNEIYFTPTYFSEVWKHTLMDSGAIYTWTQNDEVIIRYNYIHDYSGAGDNRGMFCDDGACNLKIYGNVVLNTPNCYSIDARRSKDQHEGFTNNANNFMAYNVVDGCVRFQGYGDEERHCVKGANYVIEGDTTVENKFENLETSIEDVAVQRVQDVKKFKELKNFKVKIKD